MYVCLCVLGMVIHIQCINVCVLLSFYFGVVHLILLEKAMLEGTPRKHKRKSQDAMPTHFERFVWTLNCGIVSFTVLVKYLIGEMLMLVFSCISSVVSYKKKINDWRFFTLTIIIKKCPSM